VAFACATSFPDKNGNKDAFIVTTMAIVLVTVFILGGGTEGTLSKLQIAVDVDEDLFDDSSVPRLSGGGFVSSMWGRAGALGDKWFVREEGLIGGGSAVIDSSKDIEMTSQGPAGSGRSDEDEGDTVGLVKGGGKEASTQRRSTGSRRLKKTQSSLFDFGQKS
jgi:hypothetical protein